MCKWFCKHMKVTPMLCPVSTNPSVVNLSNQINVNNIVNFQIVLFMNLTLAISLN